MPATFSLTLHFPLPPSTPPHLVIQTLHAYEPLIRPNPYLQSFRRLPVDLDEVVADPFFDVTPTTTTTTTTTATDENNNIACYEIHDRIPVVGFLGITKDTIFPAIFQCFATGVKVKVEAAMGVKVRSVYEVCPAPAAQEEGERRRQAGDEVAGHHSGLGGSGGGSGGSSAAWELVERSHVECGALLKPFVMKSFEAGHRDLCRKVLDNIASSATASTAGAGAGSTAMATRTSRILMNKDLPPLPAEAGVR